MSEIIIAHFFMHKKSAFTLVELIVVITILSILGTISFLSFQWYSSSARDSVRTEDVANISKGLELLSIERWTLPLPVNGVALTGWTTTVTQGTINNSILPRLSSNVKDVLTGKEYRYSILGNGQYYQVLAELENPLSRNISPIGIDTAYAASTVTPSLRWNYTFDPSLPSLFVSSGSTLFDPNNCFVLDKGTNTLSNPVGCTPKKSLSLKDYDSWLVWYWDMETLTGTKLADLSGNGNDGTGSGGIVIWWTGWLIWSGTFFSSGSSQYFEIQNSNSLDNIKEYTLSIVFHTSVDQRGVFLIEKTAFSLTPDYNYGLYITNDVAYTSPSIQSYTVDTAGSPISTLHRFYYATNQYYQLTGVTSKNSVKLYLNGKMVVEKKWNIDMRTWSGNLIIGAWKKLTWWGYYNGVIDDVKMYNIALSDKQISQQARASWF